MAALVAKDVNNQIRGTVHHLRAVEEIGRRADEAAEPDDAGDAIQIAERSLDLCKQVDRAGAGGILTLLDDDAPPSLPAATSLPSGPRQS